MKPQKLVNHAYDVKEVLFQLFPEATLFFIFIITTGAGISLANNQKLKEASELFKTIFIKDNNWRLLTERLPESGLLNLTKKELEDILSL